MGQVTAQVFAELSVDDPEAWAVSQNEEGIDQVGRAKVLRAFADCLRLNDAGLASILRGDGFTNEVAQAGERLSGSGASPDDLTLVFQAAGWSMMFDLLSLLDGATEPDINPADVTFGLFRTDPDDFAPIAPMEGLHESWRQVAAAVIGRHLIAP